MTTPPRPRAALPLRPWDAPELTGWGRLPMHAVPHREGDLGVERLSLDGTWRFELFPTPEQALAREDRDGQDDPDGDPGGNAALRASIEVPGCWTVQEFDDVHGVGDLPHYTNVQMPWPNLPPHPPAANPTGVYEREIEIPAGWSGRRVVLHVGAAESVLLVRLDGVDVGLSKDSHLAAEFDLTDLVTPGSVHTLRLTVVKWSDASFIEDQDQWWHGGVTRPVALYATPPVHLADVKVDATLDGDLAGGLREGDTGNGRLRVTVDVGAPGGDVPEGWSVTARLHGLAGSGSGSGSASGSGSGSGSGSEAASPTASASVPPSGPVDSEGPGASRGASLSPLEAAVIQYRRASGVALDPAEAFLAEAIIGARRPLGMGRTALELVAPGVTPWSAEVPALYDLEVVLHDPQGRAVESTRYRVGFRRIEIVGNDLLVNGVRVLIRGVNRHDFDPRTGRVIAPERIREDLLTMKRFGFNAVRTSHYPNDPALLDMADELGLFVVDEADIESHAFAHHVPHDPAYLAAFVDRVSRMVRRDVNHPSILFWSLGNESGYGANHDAAAGWVRRYDPSRPLHYEGAIMFDWTSEQTASDVVCPMYAPIDAIVAHAQSGTQRHPVILCEYSHAMGNSNGTLAEYWEAFERTPGLQGGFIWEFWDQALLQRRSDGRPAGPSGPDVEAGTGAAPEGYRWAYGGDFGEERHDGNFVADGMVFPDRTPKPAMHEHRQLAAPVRLQAGTSGRELTLENRQDVRDLSWLRASWHLVADGAGGGQAVARTVPAQLPSVPAGGTASLEVPADLVAGIPPDGEAWLTLRVESAVDLPWAPAGSPIGFAAVPVHPERRDLLTRSGGRPARRAEVAVDADGLLVHPVLAAGPQLSLWRAPTDNDRIPAFARRWSELGLDALERRLQSVDASDGVTVVTADVVTGAGHVVSHVQELTALDGGGVLVRETATVPEELADLPRVGSVFELAPAGAGTVVEWFGGGPHESYPDRRAAAEVGLWRCQVEGLFTPYVRPQESGGRHAVRWFALHPGASGGARPPAVAVHLDEPRQVSLTRYRAADLDAATHHDELVPRPEVVVHIDAAHRGLGTASCGPDTLPQYLVQPGTYTWSWTLRTPSTP